MNSRWDADGWSDTSLMRKILHYLLWSNRSQDEVCHMKRLLHIYTQSLEFVDRSGSDDLCSSTHPKNHTSFISPAEFRSYTYLPRREHYWQPKFITKLISSQFYILLSVSKLLLHHLKTKYLLVRGRDLPTMYLTTPHCKTDMPIGAQMGASITATHATWALCIKMTNVSMWD